MATSGNMMSFNELGLRKAAVLLMSLPTKAAATVLGQLPPRYIEAISVMIAQTESKTIRCEYKAVNSKVTRNQILNQRWSLSPLTQPWIIPIIANRIARGW